MHAWVAKYQILCNNSESTQLHVRRYNLGYGHDLLACLDYESDTIACSILQSLKFELFLKRLPYIVARIHLSGRTLLTFVVVFTANLFIQTKPVPKWLRALCCLKQTKRYEIPLPNEGKEIHPKEPTGFEDSERCWKEITTKIDRFCFVTFLILYAAQLIVFFAIVLK